MYPGLWLRGKEFLPYEGITWADVLKDETLFEAFLYWNMRGKLYEFPGLVIQHYQKKLEEDKKLLASGVPIDQISPPTL